MDYCDTFWVEADGSRRWLAVAELGDELHIGIGEDEGSALDDLDELLGGHGALPRLATSPLERERLFRLAKLRTLRAAGTALRLVGHE